MAFWRKSEKLALDLSEHRGLPSGELKERMMDKYFEMKAEGSTLALKDVKRNTSCGSCIKSVRASVMRYFQQKEWKDNGRLRLVRIDPLDRRPIYEKVDK